MPRILSDVRFWILSAIILGFILGDIGGENDGTVLTIALIVMMSVSLTNLELSKKDISRYRKKIVIITVASSIVCTAVTVLIGCFYDEGIRQGWIMLACVPCAIASVSGTFILKGDGRLVTLSITAIYILSIALTPLLTFLLLGNSVDPIEITKYVALFIILPFAVSFPLKRIDMNKTASTLIINISFFVLTLIAVGRSRDFILTDTSITAMIIIGVILRIVILQIICESVFRLLHTERNERIPYTLLFVWKNSGLALTLTMILFPGNGSSIAPIAISMVIEQIYFMLFVWHYKKQMPTANTG